MLFLGEKYQELQGVLFVAIFSGVVLFVIIAVMMGVRLG